MGYKDLASAIIEQAVMDLRAARRKLPWCKDPQKTMETIMEIEEFFRSDWFRVLTDVDPEYLLRKLKEEDVE